ncbi:MAG: hypothetical protein NTV63_01460 [Candidatus Woesearchaeota archaeon]|nr:hypothetical protein [Candidatus Woesearchaeota archaeon]
MEKRILVLFIAAMLMLLPVKANSIGTGIGIGMETEQFKPLIWMCGERFLYDDNIEGGRNGCDQSCQVGCQQFNNCLDERTKNYAFTGEQIQWTVLVMDKNGIEKIKDVYVAVGEQGSPDFIEANCEKAGGERGIDPFCNARILEEELIEFKPDVMEYYTCTFTVEPGMHGEYWVHSAVVDLDDQTTTVDEDEYWFFNPEIGIKVTGELYQELTSTTQHTPGQSAQQQISSRLGA